jgi:signal-transduction protein with cAMP-binding, CBS, and nucleotidyltransferase domain
MNTAEDIVKDKNQQILTVSFDDTVQKACEFMVQNRIGAVLVEKDEAYVGVWTERDLLRNITREGFDPKTAKVGKYMSSPLHTAPHDTLNHKLEEMFLGLFVRHLVIEKEGHYIGFISIGDVLRASLLEKDRRFKKINTMVGWDYYENWTWGRKKKK